MGHHSSGLHVGVIARVRSGSQCQSRVPNLLPRFGEQVFCLLRAAFSSQQTLATYFRNRRPQLPALCRIGSLCVFTSKKGVQVIVTSKDTKRYRQLVNAIARNSARNWVANCFQRSKNSVIWENQAENLCGQQRLLALALRWESQGKWKQNWHLIPYLLLAWTHVDDTCIPVRLIW